MSQIIETRDGDYLVRTYPNGSTERVLCTPEPAPTLADIIASGLRGIDTAVDQLYAAVVGNRSAEYERAEAEAAAYCAAYTAGVADKPAAPMVASWAAAKDWTMQAAAQDILAQADVWRAVQVQVRADRLLQKEMLRGAATVAAAQAALASFAEHMAAVRQSLGV